MRIGIDARMYSTKLTGIGRYVKELIDNLFEIDQKNEYVLFLNDEIYAQYMPPNPRVGKRRVSAKHYSFGEQTSFVVDLNREHLDLVHFVHFNAPVLYNKPSLVTIHDLTLSKFPGQTKTSFMHKLGYQMTIKNVVSKAQKIIAVSESTKADAIKLLGANVAKMVVIYEGVSKEFAPVTDEAKISKAKEKYGITKPYLLYTGAWRKHKNLVNLVKAYNLFRNQYDANNQLVLAGQDDPGDPEVRQTITELGLQSHVITPGYIADTDLPALYSGARVFVFPSLYEGFGLPPLEAMACGTPVAASNVTSIPEVCGSGNAAYFNPEDVNNMAEMMNKAYSDESYRAELKKKGIEQAKKYSWKKMAEEVLAVYEEIGKQLEAQKAASNKPAAPETGKQPT